jgi:site-specific recombinase XerD
MFTNPLISARKEMLRRCYSPRTIESYLFCLQRFLQKTGKEVRRITKKDVMDYLDKLAEKGLSGSTLNINLSAIKFLFEEVMHRNFYLNVKYSRRPRSLPVVLSQEEVRQLFCVIENPKHRLMIELMYSAGLRLSELLHLRVIDFEESYGWIRRGKGNKDRPFILAERLKGRIREYILSNSLKQNDFMFFGNKGQCMHGRTMQEIVKNAAYKAGIKKNVHPHTLRHSFATHLIENRCDIRDVQALLGHNRVDTTMIYVHTASPITLHVKSPLDSI